MSRPVITIDNDSSLAEALELMATNRVRHLVVTQGFKPVGVLSERDIYRCEAREPGLQAGAKHVSDAMSTGVLVARARDPLAVIAREMAARQMGAAVIVEGGEVTGIFTTTDALRAVAALAELRADEEDPTCRTYPKSSPA